MSFPVAAASPIVSAALGMFGGNQEMAVHAEGWHYLLPGTIVTIHTTEILFGRPAKSDEEVFNGIPYARTQDCRFAEADSKDWWALTLSAFAFLEMGQLEPREWKPFFPKGLPPEARQLLGSRKRWGIVVKPERVDLAEVSAYNARLASFPEVWGDHGLYYTHLEESLRVNAEYLADQTARAAAHARIDTLMDLVEAKVAENPHLTFHELVQWLMQHVMGEPGEGTLLTDSVSLFHVRDGVEGRFGLLEHFLRHYHRVTGIYNLSVSADPCMKQADLNQGELPYVVHRPDPRGNGWWVKQPLSVTGTGVRLDGEPEIPVGHRVSSVNELIEVLRQQIGDDFAIVPKAVCFLTQVLMLTSFVNPDECHYEALVKDFIRTMRVAGIDLQTKEETDGRWQQVIDGLAAFDDQPLVLPVEMALAFGQPILTGNELHGILHGQDRSKRKARLERLLHYCAEYEGAGNDPAWMETLFNEGLLPAEVYASFVDAVQKLQALGDAHSDKNQELDAERKRFASDCVPLFWQFVEGLPADTLTRGKFLRHLWLGGTPLEQLVTADGLNEVKTKISQARAFKRHLADAEVNTVLDQLTALVQASGWLKPEVASKTLETRMQAQGFIDTFGDGEEVPAWAVAVAEAFVRRRTELESALTEIKERWSAKRFAEARKAAVAHGQFARAQVLKALHSLQLVDYYIGPVIGWVMGGESYNQRIRSQIRVIDHPVAPRL